MAGKETDTVIDTTKKAPKVKKSPASSAPTKKVKKPKQMVYDPVGNKNNPAYAPKSLAKKELKGKNTSFAEDMLNSKAVKSAGAEADKMVGKAYRAITKKTNKPKKEKKKKTRKYPQGFSQSLVPIKAIKYGIIQTTSGQYVKILEILPIDYYSLSPTLKNRVIDDYERVFHNTSSNIHIKVINDTSNPKRLIDYIKQRCEEENYQRGLAKKVIKCAQAKIDHIRQLSDNSSITKRYFFIYRYEGKEPSFENAYYELETMKLHYESVFREMGNSVVEYDTIQESTMATADILYYYLNRKSYRDEQLQERIARMVNDCNLYNQTSGENRDVYDGDFLAPKGAKFISNDLIFIDGTYKTWLALSDNGHPQMAEAGWIDQLAIGNGSELDIWIKRLNHEYVQHMLEQKIMIDVTSAKEKASNPTKQEEILSKARNASYITTAMASGEDLFDCVIIITLSAPSIKELRIKKKALVQQLNSKRFYTEDAWQYTYEYFNATLPLMEMPNALFMRNKHNYLTSSLKSLYPFTAFEMYDPTGFMLGNSENNSIVSINLFNTSIVNNANMALIGSSGSGKTFTSQILAYSMRLTGIRTMFILPVKGYEYKRGCLAISGSYIKLGPGQKDVINPCAIIPEQKIDKDLLADTIAYDQASQLAKKISFLITWIQLHEPKKEFSTKVISLMSTALTEMYFQFGITEDNESIWEDKASRKLKVMPVVSDMYNIFNQYSDLEEVASILLDYINGPFANFNAPTNVDLDNKYIVFDVDEADMAKKYLPPMLWIAFDCCYGLAKQSRLSKDIIFLDEVWKMMSTDAASEQVKEMVKLIRGYGGGVVIATQELGDFLANSSGASVLNNTATKLLLHLEDTDCETVSQHIPLSEIERTNIVRYPRGSALLLSGKNRVSVSIKPSKSEERAFTTDPTLLARFAEEDKKAKEKRRKKLRIKAESKKVSSE